MKNDITDKNDVIALLTAFYDKLLADSITRHIFKNIDMEEHIPIIANFWCMVLFGDNKYKGNPFDKHLSLGLKKEHFTRWLLHFENTINNSYEGPKAELAKQRANSIAFIFQSKLGAY